MPTVLGNLSYSAYYFESELSTPDSECGHTCPSVCRQLWVSEAQLLTLAPIFLLVQFTSETCIQWTWDYNNSSDYRVALEQRDEDTCHAQTQSSLLTSEYKGAACETPTHGLVQQGQLGTTKI